MAEPISFDEESAKLQRRRVVSDQMRRDRAVWMGDCAECWLPLTYPPIAIPKLETLRWSTQNPDQVELERTFLCVECAKPALETYASQIQTPPKVDGTPFSESPNQ